MDNMIIVLATPQAVYAYIKGHGAPAEGARFEGGPGLLQGSGEIIPRFMKGITNAQAGIVQAIRGLPSRTSVNDDTVKSAEYKFVAEDGSTVAALRVQVNTDNSRKIYLDLWDPTTSSVITSDITPSH